MTKQLEKVFDLPEMTKEEMEDALAVADNVTREIKAIDPKGDDVLDTEIDGIAAKAMNSYEDLMNLGMNGTWTNSSTCNPKGEAFGMMITAVVLSIQFSLTVISSTKFTTPNHQCFVK